ncbi:MAG: hypothetical protein R2932_42615 [Caldilineaceae bacterium]
METATADDTNLAKRWQQLLISSNHDGFVDGVTTCFVPLQTDVPSVLWTALANVAARLGLEAPAIHLPLVCTEDAIQPWQSHSSTRGWRGNQPHQWSKATDQPALVDGPALQIFWMTQDQQTGFWIHGNDVTAVVEWLTQLAIGTTEKADPTSKPQGARQPLDLARLYRGGEQGLFAANGDGFMAVRHTYN